MTNDNTLTIQSLAQLDRFELLIFLNAIKKNDSALAMNIATKERDRLTLSLCKDDQGCIVLIKRQSGEILNSVLIRNVDGRLLITKDLEWIQVLLILLHSVLNPTRSMVDIVDKKMLLVGKILRSIFLKSNEIVLKSVIFVTNHKLENENENENESGSGSGNGNGGHKIEPISPDASKFLTSEFIKLNRGPDQLQEFTILFGDEYRSKQNSYYGNYSYSACLSEILASQDYYRYVAKRTEFESGKHGVFSKDKFLITSSVQYVFSDNFIFTLRELVTSSYAVLVDENLLPRLSDKISNELQSVHWIFKPFLTKIQSPDHSLKSYGQRLNSSMPKLLTDLAIRATDYCRTEKGKEVSLFLSDNIDRGVERFALTFTSIGKLPKESNRWSINDLVIRGGLSGEHLGENLIDLGNNLLLTIDKENRKASVYQHDFYEHKQKANYITTEYPAYYQELDECLDFEYDLKKSLNFPSFPQRLIETIDGLRSAGTLTIDADNDEIYDHKNSIIRIDLSSENHDYMKVSLKLNDQIGSTEYWPRMCHTLVAAMRYGIGCLTESSNQRVAKQAHGDTRKNDLFVLKHSGFYLYLIYTTLNKVRNSPPQNAKESKKLEKRILLELGNLFVQIIDKHKHFIPLQGADKNADKNADKDAGRDAVSIKEFISSRVIHLIKDVLDVLGIFGGEKNLDYNYYVVNNKLVRICYSKMLNDLLLIYLTTIFKTYGPNIFLKQNLAAFNFGENFNKIENVLPNVFLNGSELFGGAGVNTDSNSNSNTNTDTNTLSNDAHQMKVELYIDGRAVETLGPEDFKTEFNISENSSGKIDWFELHPKVFFKGEEISQEEAAKFTRANYLEHKGKFYLLNKKHVPGIKWLDFFWSKLASRKMNDKMSCTGENIVQQERSQILDMLALREKGVPVVGGTRWNEICKQFDLLKMRNQERADFSLERLSLTALEKKSGKKLEVPLKDYQRIGTSWLLDLYNIGFGGILADDMGLGKTIQVLGLLELLRLNGRLGHNIIVVPTSLVYNWVEESKKFTPKIVVKIFESSNATTYLEEVKQNSSSVYVITYGVLERNILLFKSIDIDIVFFDEAQNLKNIRANRTGAARMLKANSKFCLTGTPMENHYGEFYSLIDIALPGSLGDYKDFMSSFSFAGAAGASKVSAEDIEFLKAKTAPIVLRRTKKMVLTELPSKTESVISLPFESAQKKIYRDIAISWNDRIQAVIEDKGEKCGQIEMLTALLRLRQVCSFPQILSDIEYSGDAPKLEILMEAIAELYENKESVIVFTNFRTSLNFIEQRLQEKGYKVLTISGEVTAKNRVKVLEEFNKDSEPVVLLMTLKTGGVGLNLTKASYVFHIEPWWNPAAEDQATDRVYRIGQEKPVQVYRYIMEESVEEKIQHLKSLKSAAFDALFAEKEDDLAQTSFTKRTLTKSDFDYLLNL